MVLTISNLNASSVVQCLSGSAGVTLISVSPAISARMRETMCLVITGVSCPNVLVLRSAPSKLSILKMEKSSPLVVLSVGMIRRTLKTSEMQ